MEEIIAGIVEDFTQRRITYVDIRDLGIIVYRRAALRAGSEITVEEATTEVDEMLRRGVTANNDLLAFVKRISRAGYLSVSGGDDDENPEGGDDDENPEP